MSEFFFYVLIFVVIAICLSPFSHTNVASTILGILFCIFLIDYFYFEFLISCVLDPLKEMAGTKLKS